MQLIRSRLFLGTLIVFSSLIALVNPVVFTVTLPLAWRPIFWLLNGGLVTATWLLQFWLWVSLMWWLRRDVVIPSGLFYSISMAVLILVNYVVLQHLFGFGPLGSAAIWSEILRYTLIAVVFELLLVVFILPYYPQIRRVRWNGDPIEQASENDDTAENRQTSETAELPDLEVQDRKIALDGLLYLKSVEHYVEFVFHEGNELLRAALRDLIDQLGPEHGVQTHRSYWVQRKAIDGLIRQNGHPFLRLKNGTEIPVSRTRRKEVSEWMQRFGPEDL